jgi:hypothetical protein
MHLQPSKPVLYASHLATDMSPETSVALRKPYSGFHERYGLFRRGAAVAQRTVNPLVVGSNPTAGANLPSAHPHQYNEPATFVIAVCCIPGSKLGYDLAP